MPYLPSVCYVSPSAFYVVLWFGTPIWSSTSGFSKPFYREAPGSFRCPLLQGNSVGGYGRALPPGLSAPWLPVGHSSSVVHSMSSPTVPTCAPGTVPQVLVPTVLSHCLYRQAPTLTSGEKHSQCHLHTRQCRCLTLRTPLKDKQRLVDLRTAPETMHLQSERPTWYTPDQVLPHRARAQSHRQ
jgi:hypothetical protein